MYEDLDAVGLLSAMQDDQRAERSATTRRLIAAGRLCRQRIAEMGDDRDQWCIDGWEAVAAEVGAELRISRGRASSLMNYGLTLLERLPRLAAVCLAGDVDFRVIALIEYRTGLITDADVLARIDVALARQVPHWSALSRDKVAELIDWLVVELDPEAVRMARQADVDRHIEVGPSANGMAEVWGRLRATDGAAFDKTLDELAASVCPDDPRTKVQRRADAVIALTNRAMTMACTCGSANCSAAGGTDADRTQIVLHVIAEKATVQGDGAKPGYLSGYGAIPADAVQELAKRAKIRPLIQPKDFRAELQYRPSAALADFIQSRDLTCRFPGCNEPADVSDIDHTVPYPIGPTHPSNLKPYCRPHHLLKTFYAGPGGWSECQLVNGTIVLTSPSGRVYATKPSGSLFFPQLAQPGEALGPAAAPPVGPGRTLAMPVRRRTRAAERAARIEWERGVNRARIAANPPPF
jgi:hypothetical protein